MMPAEIKKMPLADFERMFGFRPTDALEKKWFAITGERISDISREFVSLIEPIDLSDVVME